MVVLEAELNPVMVPEKRAGLVAVGARVRAA
jgi:hypothetical protein